MAFKDLIHLAANRSDFKKFCAICKQLEKWWGDHEWNVISPHILDHPQLTKSPAVLFLRSTQIYNHGQISLINLNAAHRKQLFTFPPLEFLQVTSPSPLPLYNADLGSADCRETVRDLPNKEEEEEGAGKIWSLDCLLVKILRRVRFLNRLVHDCVSQLCQSHPEEERN